MHFFRATDRILHKATNRSNLHNEAGVPRPLPTAPTTATNTHDTAATSNYRNNQEACQTCQTMGSIHQKLTTPASIGLVSMAPTIAPARPAFGSISTPLVTAKPSAASIGFYVGVVVLLLLLFLALALICKRRKRALRKQISRTVLEKEVVVEVEEEKVYVAALQAAASPCVRAIDCCSHAHAKSLHALWPINAPTFRLHQSERDLPAAPIRTREMSSRLTGQRRILGFFGASR